MVIDLNLTSCCKAAMSCWFLKGYRCLTMYFYYIKLLSLFRFLRVVLGSLIPIAGFCLASYVTAAEYSIDNDISLTGRFDDNARLSVGFKDELYGAVLTNKTNLARATEISNLDVELELKANQFNIDAYSTFDQLLDVGYFRNTERGYWNINARVDHGSTRDSEATQSGSGVFDLRDTRITSHQLSFGLSNNLNLRNLLVWNASANAVQYDNDRSNDYKFGSTSLLWQFILTERFRLQATAAYSVLDSDAASGLAINPIFNDAVEAGTSIDLIDNIVSECSNGQRVGLQVSGGSFIPCFQQREFDNEQATTRLQAGVYYLISERLTLDLLVGQSSVDTDSEVVYVNLPERGANVGMRTEKTSTSNDGLTYTVGLNHVMETIENNLNISSSNTVNSNGILVLNTSVELNTSWTINSWHSIYNSFAWFDQETSSRDDAFFTDRVLSRWSFRYQYLFNSEWSGSFNYRIYEQRRDTQDREAYSNSWTLTLAWQPTTLKWSR